MDRMKISFFLVVLLLVFISMAATFAQGEDKGNNKGNVGKSDGKGNTGTGDGNTGDGISNGNNGDGNGNGNNGSGIGNGNKGDDNANGNNGGGIGNGNNGDGNDKGNNGNDIANGNNGAGNGNGNHGGGVGNSKNGVGNGNGNNGSGIGNDNNGKGNNGGGNGNENNGNGNSNNGNGSGNGNGNTGSGNDNGNTGNGNGNGKDNGNNGNGSENGNNGDVSGNGNNGNGNGNGNNGNGNSNGNNGDGNGKGNNNGNNSDGHGNGNNGNGNAKGNNGDGNGNGNNGNGNGNGNNGNGNSNGNNGNGNENSGNGKGNGKGNSDNGNENGSGGPIVQTKPDKYTCPATPLGGCSKKLLVCPSECPERKPKMNKKGKGCYIDCNKCETSCKVRRANCDGYGAICYDPRFIGGDGTMFYFHGAKGGNFALVSDDELQINAHFIGTRPQGRTRDFTWVQALSIMFDTHNLVLAARTVSKWDDNVDSLLVRWDGETVEVPTDGEAEWKINTGVRDVVVERTDDTNSIRVTVSGLVEIDIKVTPIGAKENRVHKYHIPSDDAFAHLETQFKFVNLSDSVEGVLGQTYQPDYVSPVKVGVSMPMMGGEDKYQTPSFLSPLCKSCRFQRTAGTKPLMPAVIKMVAQY